MTTRCRSLFAAVLSLSTILGSTHAMAGNILGAYVGGSIGEADVRNPFALPVVGDFAGHDFGWKAMVGLRPIPLLGAELSYTDFGSQSAYVGSASAKAAALYGMLYLPLPVPFLDVYAKAGLARVQQNVSGSNPGAGTCPINFPNCALFSFSRNGTDAAFGAGAQFKFADWAVRAEYERIQASGGSPDLLSVGLTWTF